MRLWRTIKNHLLPWRGNSHRPHILRRNWLVAFLGLALVSEGVILGHTALKEGPNVFLAAVVRADVIGITQEARTDLGRGELRENETLNAAAQAKAQDMASKGYFSHVTPSGEQPWVWFERQGYNYVYAGENLAVRFNDSKDVVDAWMASPTHRANIAKAQYQEIGVGIAEGRYKGEMATFVVQFFASPAAGVAAGPQVSSVPEATDPVAGAEIGPAPAGSFMQSATRFAANLFTESGPAASWILATIAAVLITVLALTFFIRIQVQPTDLLLPGIAAALAVVLLLGANSKFLPAMTSQSASVSLSASEGDVGEAAAVERANIAFPEHPNQ
ncbi:MAG: hypothetical protein JWL87_454 [Candidatus Adlerbacteria bacterium]|nr:hypothetical protein [Candidatus Adlerbacteria bacterium]